MNLKKSLLLELDKKKILRMAIHFLGRDCFGWVDRSTANQHLSKVGLIKICFYPNKWKNVHFYFCHEDLLLSLQTALFSDFIWPF